MQTSRHRACEITRLVTAFLGFNILFAQYLLLWALDCRAAAVYEMRSKRFVFERNSRKLLPPASTIKVFTALYVLNELPPYKYITISEKAANVEPNKAYLRLGEEYKVIDLMYAMLISSANDAAQALAEEIERSSKMSYEDTAHKIARAYGLRDTYPLTPHGLPYEGQVTTARDLCIIMAKAINCPLIKKALTLPSYTFYDKTGRSIGVKNHNKLLRQQAYRNVLGKTGYTKKAGHCFVGYFSIGDKEYTFAIMGGKSLWNNVKELVEIIKANRSNGKRKRK